MTSDATSSSTNYEYVIGFSSEPYVRIEAGANDVSGDDLRDLYRRAAEILRERAEREMQALFECHRPLAWAQETLGLGADCAEAEVKSAFRRLAMQHHPDKGGDGETFKELIAARDLLLEAI